MTDVSTTALTNIDLAPIPTPLTTGSSSLSLDGVSRLYAITTGGTGGVEVVDIQDPDLPVDGSYNPGLIGMRLTLYVAVQTDPADVVKVLRSGNPFFFVYPSTTLRNSFLQQTNNGIILDYVGAMAQLVWCGDRWEFDVAITQNNDNSTFASANNPFKVTTADATNGNVADVTIGPGAHSGTGSAGNLKVQNIPTADPHVAGAVWNNSGVLTVSAG